MKEKYERIKDENKDLEEKNEELENEIEELENEHEELENEFEELENEHKELEQKYEKLENEIENFEEKYEKEIEKLENKHEKFEEKHEKEIEKLEKEIEKLENEQENLEENHKNEIKNLENEHEKLENKYEDLQQKYKDLEKNYENIREKINTINSCGIFKYDENSSTMMYMLTNDDFAEYYDDFERLQKDYCFFTDKNIIEQIKKYNRFYYINDYVICTSDNKNVKIFDNYKNKQYEVECDFDKIDQLTIFKIVIHLKYENWPEYALELLKNL